MRSAIALALAITLGACSSGSERRAERVTTSSSTSSTSSTTTTTTISTSAVNASDAPALASLIERATAAIAAPDTTAEALTAAALDQQLSYRRLARDVNLEKAVIALLPPALRAGASANVGAGRELIALSPPKNPAPPAAWKIIPPAPGDELLGYYNAAQREFGVPWHVLAAVHLVETRMGRIRGDSSAGARGPMQFLPATWNAYGEGDIESNKDSIRCAARYLKANGAPERLADALYRYNRSTKYVRAVTAYSEQMAADPKAYRGYHQWQVVYRTTNGALLLPEGWPAVAAQPVAE